MAVSDSWTDPVANHDLSLGNLITENIWDQVMSNILHAGRGNEPSLTNKSGSSRSVGDVVIVDSSNDSAFTTTTTADAANVLGVVMDTIANNAAGRVAVAGLVTVNVQGNVTRGNYLSTSTTAGRAKDAGSAKTTATFAVAMTSYAGGGAGTVSAIILPAIQVASASASGDLKAIAGSSLPTGWLWCDGSAVSRTTYADLFTAIGTTYGVGDGSTTFNVPDLRGRAPVGKDNMGGSAANRITPGGSGGAGTTLGASFGAETHTLVTNEMTPHTHNVPDGNGGGGTILVDVIVSTASGSNVVTSSVGGGAAHNNTQPSLIVNYIIKT